MWTGDEMVAHHEDAIAAVMMAQRLLWRGADHEAVARLAREIRDGQLDEIVQMRRWLAQWFDDAPNGSTTR